MHLKEVENSKVWVKIKDDEYKDSFGQKIIKVHWEEATKEINLGSLKKPNKNILEIKIEGGTEKQTRSKNPFENLFIGFSND